MYSEILGECSHFIGYPLRQVFYCISEFMYLYFGVDVYLYVVDSIFVSNCVSILVWVGTCILWTCRFVPVWCICNSV